MRIEDEALTLGDKDLYNTDSVFSRPILNITVTHGIDQGKTLCFDQNEIRIGRNKLNDFRLSDHSVSNRHGLFTRTDEGFYYEDLGSRYGSTVMVHDDEVTLGKDESKRVPLPERTTLKIGRTEVHLKIDRISNREHTRKATFLVMSESAPEVMAAQNEATAIGRQFKDRDPRLEILFRMAHELNGLTRLDQILDFVADACFEALPKANLFSLNLLQEDELRPAGIRAKGLQDVSESEIVISRSVVKRVVETKEAILFVHGMGGFSTKSLVDARISACMCAPLSGRHSLLGVVQLDTRQAGALFTEADLNLFTVFASNLAFALERINLTEDIYRMFEGFTQASVNAIEARDPVTAGHSERVARYSMALANGVNKVQVGELAEINYTRAEMAELRYAALLHDFGKVGVRESVLMKAHRLEQHKMDILIQRFERIKEIYAHNLIQEQYEKVINGEAPPLADDLANIQAKVEQFRQMLNNELTFIQSIQQKRRLSKDDQERILSLNKRSIKLSSGGMLPFLKSDEMEMLTVAVGTLSKEEWQDMRSHVSRSQSFLEHIPWSDDLKMVPCIAGRHHEKMDGSGYPLGLKDSDIPVRTRMLTIADIFDAVTSMDRPYHRAITPDKAAILLEDEAAAGRLDKDLVNFFVESTLKEIIHTVPSIPRP